MFPYGPDMSMYHYILNPEDQVENSYTFASWRNIMKSSCSYFPVASGYFTEIPDGSQEPRLSQAGFLSGTVLNLAGILSWQFLCHKLHQLFWY